MVKTGEQQSAKRTHTKETSKSSRREVTRSTELSGGGGAHLGESMRNYIWMATMGLAVECYNGSGRV